MDLEHLRASDGTGEAVLAHVDAVRTAGSTVLVLDSVDNWNSKAIVITGTPATNGYIAPAGMTIMYGHLNSGDFIIDGYAPGYSDNGNTTTQIAIVKMCTSWADTLIDLLQIIHDDDGKLKVNAPITGGTTLSSGWLSAEEAWSYDTWTSATRIATITVPTDATTKYSNGMRVKFTQPTNGVKYGIIVKVEATKLTVFLPSGTDFDNEAITSPCFSMVKIPAGFNANPALWKLELVDTSSKTQSSPSSGVWYNIGSLSLALPIGVWDLEYAACMVTSKGSASDINASVTLSTANNSESDSEFTSVFGAVAGTNTIGTYQNSTRRKIISLAAATTYYMNVMSPSSPANIRAVGSSAATVIRATCAYL